MQTDEKQKFQSIQDAAYHLGATKHDDGRIDAFNECSWMLRQKSGEYYANGNDDMAVAFRDMAKEIEERAKGFIDRSVSNKQLQRDAIDFIATSVTT